MPSLDSPDLTIRSLESYGELLACVELQKQTWGTHFDDVVSAALMRVCQKIGGVAAGAFDAEGQLVGTVFGMTGVRAGQLVHWSHMLAVRSDRQDRGLGRRLKQYQRARVLALGVTLMHWTYDPLEARNAHFNLNRLGAGIDSYVRDLYGTGEASPLHRGLGTDRFIVAWLLDAPRTERALAGRPPPVDDAGRQAPIVNPDGRDGERVEGRVVRVQIPSVIQALKAAAPDEAVRWRHSTRRAFEHYLPRGYTVDGFYREGASCFYVLKALSLQT